MNNKVKHEFKQSDFRKAFPKMYWYNYCTNSYELGNAPQTDEEALRYLPQQLAVMGAYSCRRQLGETVLEAMLNVLKVCVGEVPDKTYEKED